MESFQGQHKISAEERFWPKVAIKSNEECWNWKAGKNEGGYGKFWLGSEYIYAHRFAWELHYKRKVPKGMCILHHCDNPTCVNHHHLYYGTHSENRIDASIRGRLDMRKYSCRAKLYDEEIWLIKRLWASGKLTQTKIAKMFKMARPSITDILSGKTKYTRGSCHD